MPKSDTWPGGVGLDPMTSMDSAGSCDSVVSANSGFSDDSLEHLSAEEKACIMFLEETIESLDTEEDSGLSNDEPDRLPNPGNLASKLADLSAAMGRIKIKTSRTHSFEELRKDKVDTDPIQSYLVPTPLVMASSSLCSGPSTKLGAPTDKDHISLTSFIPSSKEPGLKHNQKPEAPEVPTEVNVVIPPPTKPRKYSVRIAEGPPPRGPLSYDALFHLQRSASTKKTPLCPTIDHTIDIGKNHPLKIEVLKPRPDRFQSETSTSKRSPPVVPPKPKKIPANVSMKPPNQTPSTSDSSYEIKNATDPKVVRLEALQKLGLLKEPQPENDTVAPLPRPKPHNSLDPTPNRITKGPANVNPSRSPSFCSSQGPSEPRNRSVQSSASFHHHIRRDHQPVSEPHPTQSNGLKAASLERSATLDNHRNRGNCPESGQITAKSVKPTTVSQPAPTQAPNSVGYTVMVLPGMGTDRKEALRKLGLLKN